MRLFRLVTTSLVIGLIVIVLAVGHLSIEVTPSKQAWFQNIQLSVAIIWPQHHITHPPGQLRLSAVPIPRFHKRTDHTTPPKDDFSLFISHIQQALAYRYTDNGQFTARSALTGLQSVVRYAEIIPNTSKIESVYNDQRKQVRYL